jgi:RNA polymerase subunit RPABC4/transcription elongation factor Spt4
MNANLLAILKQIVAEQGESVLAEPQRLKALFSDYAKNEQKEERVAFGRCIEMGAYQELKKTNTDDERWRVKAALMDQLNAKTGIDRVRCAEALDLLEAVMFKPEPHGTPASLQTRVCSSCGKELQKEWTSCPYCSTPVANKVCSKCGKELQKEWEVCPYCKTSVAKTGIQANRQEQPQTAEMPKNIKKLLLAATIVGLVISLFIFILIISLVVTERFYIGYLFPFVYIVPLLIATMLNVGGQRKNNIKMILAAGIVYLTALIFGLPSAILCFIVYAKMKKTDKAKS